MKVKTSDQRHLDDIRVLIEEAKIRNNLNEPELSRCLGISTTTLSEQKKEPGRLTVAKLLILLHLAGKEIQYINKNA